MLIPSAALLTYVFLSSRTHNQEREIDQLRQDSVAANVAEVASVAAASAGSITAKLAQIHILVNSDMTAARQAELDQARLMLTAVRRVVQITTSGGDRANPADLKVIEDTVAHIGDLERILADRLAQFRESEQAAGKEDGGLRYLQLNCRRSDRKSR